MKVIKQGARAFRFPKFQDKGGIKVLRGNPYDPASDEHRQWEQGYNEAYFSHLEKVKKKEANEQARAGS